MNFPGCASQTGGRRMTASTAQWRVDGSVPARGRRAWVRARRSVAGIGLPVSPERGERREESSSASPAAPACPGRDGSAPSLGFSGVIRRLRLPTMRRAGGGRTSAAIPGNGTAGRAGALARSVQCVAAGLLLGFAALLALPLQAQAQTTISIGAETDGTGDAEGVEGATIELTVKLSAVSAVPVTGMWRYVPGTARSADYGHDGNQNLTIAAGATTATVSVDLVDDTKYEGEESFEVELYNVVGATIGRSRAQITIDVDDSNPDLPSFRVDSTTVDVNEDDGTVTVQVVHDAFTAQDTDITITYETADGTATQPDDYTATSGTLTFPAGSRETRTVTIPIVNDANEEADETFEVEFGAPSVGAFDSGGAKATVTIEANDPPSTVATLSGLALKDAADDSTIDLNETFVSTTKDYTADVANDVDEITVEPTSDHNATFAYLNASDTALTDADTLKTGFQAALAVGANTVKVKVTSEDGNADDIYSVVVTRAAPGNTAATGKPSITGAAQAGMTLTAGLGDIADADTLPASGYMYQWIRGGSALLGATGSSLTLGTSNLNGQKLRVRVSFTDVAGFLESRTSDETLPVAPSAAACPTDAATVWCATLTVGHLLDEDNDAVQSGYEARSGRTAFGSVTGGGAFRHLGVDYTVTALVGVTHEDLYLATTPNLPAGGAGLTVHVQTYGGEVDGPLAEAEFITHSSSWRFLDLLLSSPTDPLADTPLIRGIYTRSARILEPTDLGTKVRVRLSYAAPTGPATGKPSITGTAQVGQTLTAGTSGISDPDGNTKAENGDAGFAYTYRWYRVDAGTETAIPGATGSSYTLVQADEGKTFRVAVSFTDDAGNIEGPRTSNEYPAGAENGELRLEGGPTALEGRLEVFHDGEWGTVCDDRQDNRNNVAPALACRFVGYANGVLVARDEITPNMSVAPASQRIWLDDVRCFLGSNHWTGAPPEALHHCYHAGWGNHNCTHEEDVHLRCVEGLGMQTEATALTASFEDMPQSHDGSGAFTFRIAFSAEVTVSPQDMKDHALTVAGGTVTNATRVDGRSDLWELTVTPAGTGAVSILVPQNRACTETGALCTADGQALSTGLGHNVPGPAPAPQGQQAQQALEPLAAGFVAVPPEHDGETAFWLELRFDAAVAQGSKPHIQALLGVTGGSVTRMRRKDGRLDHWRIRIQPSSHAAVTVTLSPSPACGAAGAVCTEDGRTFTTALATRIQGPPGLSVADAEVQEGPNATLAFAVTLSRAPSSTVSVGYATSDGTATAGSDYTATSGTLSFAAGETEKTVSVPVLDDAHDEGSETLSLSLSNPSGAYLEDGTATGTITNTDHMPQAWMARFGRTVADQVLDAVDARLRAARTAGMSVSVGGQAIRGAALQADAGSGASSGGVSASLTGVTAAEDAEEVARLQALSDWLSQTTEEKDRPVGSSRTLTGRELLMGSSFSLAAGTDGGSFAALWGRMAQSRFAGREDAISLDGDVTTGLLGADYASGRWTTGLVVSHSVGEGGYRGENAGAIEAAVTALTPWAGYAVTERLSVWGAAGYGTGDLTLTPAGDVALQTDLGMMLAAAGVRGALVAGAGPKLDLVGDARWVRTTTASVSSSAGNLESASAAVTRLRLGLDGSWPLALGTGVLGGGASVTPRLALGLRHDGGDAETGFGVDIAGGVALQAPARGLTVSLDGRGVLTHAASGLRDRGIAGTLSWEPPPANGRGPKLTLSQTIGASASSGTAALLSRDTLEGLAANDNGAGRRRLEVRLGYGIGVYGDRFTLTPELGLGLSEAGRDTRLGWRLTRTGSGAGSLELSLEAERREGANDNDPPEQGIGLRLTARF